MTSITRIQSIWTNFNGAPGYTSFHFQTADTPTDAQVSAAATASRAFFVGLVSLFPTGLTITQSGNASVYDITGFKTAEKAYTPGAATVGTSTAAYAGGTGAVIHWKTGFYTGGRQFVGRTFLVPLAGGYATDGTLTPTAVSTLQGAANTLRGVTSPQFVIWSHKPGSATAASSTAVTVPDRTATMRSRR